MTTGKALNGKPYAGNPHVAPSQRYGGTSRFDEGEVASAATPRRGSLLYKRAIGITAALLCVICAADLVQDFRVPQGVTRENTGPLFWLHGTETEARLREIGNIGTGNTFTIPHFTTALTG